MNCLLWKLSAQRPIVPGPWAVQGGQHVYPNILKLPVARQQASGPEAEHICNENLRTTGWLQAPAPVLPPLHQPLKPYICKHFLAMEQVWKNESFFWHIQEKFGLQRKSMTTEHSEIIKWDHFFLCHWVD